jgi:thioredoxin-like negative regulator of GroEL
MRVLSILSFLLSGLLCSAAPPVKTDAHLSPFSEELTFENFETKVANGIWFIKHYSPYCKHCTELAPVWNEIAEKMPRQYNGRVNFGSVDCVANGDICNDNDVKAFPVMQWYPFPASG